MPTPNYKAQTWFPDANPIRFVPYNYPSRNAGYNMPAPDGALFANSIPYFQDNPHYYQTLQLNDRITLQYHASNSTVSTNPSVLHIKKVVNGNLVDVTTRNPDLTVILTNWNADDGQQFQTFQYNFVINSVTALASLPYGTYFLVLETNFASDGSSTADITNYLISEPIILAQVHRGTQRVEYSNTTNLPIIGLLFEQTNYPLFMMRIDSAISQQSVEAEDTSYEDVSWNLKYLSSFPYYIFNWVIGTTQFGTTDYILTKLRLAMICDTLQIDGAGYVKNDTSKGFDVQVYNGTLKRYGSIKLRPVSNTQYGKFVYQTPVLIYALPGAYPYAVSQIKFTLASHGLTRLIVNPSSPIIINSSGDESAMITTLNASVAQQGLNGTFSIVSGNLVYTNNTFPAEVSNASVNILTTYLTLNLTPATTTSCTLNYGLYGTNFAIDHADGTVNGALFTTASDLIYTKAYGTLSTSTTYHARIFFDETSLFNPTLSEIRALGSAHFSGSFSDRLPQNLKVLISAIPITTFNFALFNNTTLLLNKLIINHVGLTTLLSVSTTNMPHLNNIDLSINALTESAANSFISNFYNGTYIAHGTIQSHGTLDIHGQAGGGSFNTSDAAYLAMIASPILWTITHD